MAHGTIRAFTLQAILKLIIDYYKTDEDTAMNMFYNSHTGKCYSDNTTGLYGQSALYVFSLFLEEFGENNGE